MTAVLMKSAHTTKSVDYHFQIVEEVPPDYTYDNWIRIDGNIDIPVYLHNGDSALFASFILHDWAQANADRLYEHATKETK